MTLQYGDRAIRYFPAAMADDIMIALDTNDIVAVFAEVEPKMVIGESPEEICLVYLRTLGESKPIRLKVPFEELITTLGWPSPPPGMRWTREKEEH